ncbi:hypothetical protein Tco_0701481 [Tanacetum coccineum]
MCKAYGCEPSIDFFLGFFNLCRADSWLTFQKRFEKHIPNLLSKVITRIEAWHERFFFVQGFIISSKYPQLLLDENKLNLKSFKDKLLPNIDKIPYFQRLGRYPTSVRVFNDPILFLAGPKPLWEFGQQRSAIIGCVPRSLFWREDLDGDGERGFNILTFALASSKAHREGLLVVIGRRSYSGFKEEDFEPERRDTIAMQRYGLSAKELNEFLSSYPIPTYYDVILPTSIQTIFDAPAGYVS